MATPTTLPASFTAGQVLTAAQMNNLRGGFRILQVLSATTSTVQSSSTSTYADATGFSISITPSATTNKILMVYMTNAQKTSANANNNPGFKFFRGATEIAAWANPLFTGTAMRLVAPVTLVYLDSPATTSAITYKVQFANHNNNGAAVEIQEGNTPGTMLLLEVSL